jgi:membrane protein DedA with SNARE-associated domain
MQEIIIEIMEQYGYIGIFLLILVENIFPPIPSEIILSFAGFMTKSANLSVMLVIVSATLGSVAGAVILYKIGNRMNRQSIRGFVGKHGRVLRLKVDDIDKTMKFYRKYETKTVFFGRMIPVVRSLISIPAGLSRMNFTSFILLTAAGSIIWNSLLITAGMVLGNAWHDIVKFTSAYSEITIVVFAAAGLLFVMKRRKKI